MLETLRTPDKGPEKSPGKSWRVLNSQVAYANPYFNVLQQQVEVDGSHDRTYYIVDFPRPAVGILATRGNELLLIRQYRFIVDEHVWAIPSGAADEDESLNEAARRELLEETGYSAASVSPFLHSYASYGSTNQRFEIFHADDLVKVRRPDAAEVLEVCWFEREKVREMVETNGIVDSLSLSPILLWLLRTEEKQ